MRRAAAATLVALLTWLEPPGRPRVSRAGDGHYDSRHASRRRTAAAFRHRPCESLGLRALEPARARGRRRARAEDPPQRSHPRAADRAGPRARGGLLAAPA